MSNDDIELKELLLSEYLTEKKLEMYLNLKDKTILGKILTILKEMKLETCVFIIIIIRGYVILLNNSVDTIKLSVNSIYISVTTILLITSFVVFSFLTRTKRVNKKINELNIKLKKDLAVKLSPFYNYNCKKTKKEQPVRIALKPK